MYRPPAERGRCARRVAGPAHRVGDDPLHERVVVRRVRLVAGLEVEDATAAALVAATAPEHLAALEPADQHEPVWSRDVEVLAVHLLVLDVERLAEAGRDRMPRVHHPHPFPLARLAPFEGAGRSHQATEDLRVVAGVKDHETHPVEHASVDAVHHRVSHLVVRPVTPPCEDVGRVKDSVAHALLRVVERRCADLEIGAADPSAMAPWIPAG